MKMQYLKVHKSSFHLKHCKEIVRSVEGASGVWVQARTQRALDHQKDMFLEKIVKSVIETNILTENLQNLRNVQQALANRFYFQRKLLIDVC